MTIKSGIYFTNSNKLPLHDDYYSRQINSHVNASWFFMTVFSFRKELFGNCTITKSYR